MDFILTLMDFILHIMISCATKIVTLLLAYHFGLIGWVPTSWFDPIYGITGTVIEEGAGGAASLGFLHRIPVVRSLPLSVQWCAVSHQTAALIPHSSFLIPHSPFFILCAPFPHFFHSSFSSFIIPHFQCLILHRSFLFCLLSQGDCTAGEGHHKRTHQRSHTQNPYSYP